MGWGRSGKACKGTAEGNIDANSVRNTQQEHQEYCSKEERRDPSQMPHSWKRKLQCPKANATQEWKFTSPKRKKCSFSIAELLLSSLKGKPPWGLMKLERCSFKHLI